MHPSNTLLFLHRPESGTPQPGKTRYIGELPPVANVRLCRSSTFLKTDHLFNCLFLIAKYGDATNTSRLDTAWTVWRERERSIFFRGYRCALRDQDTTRPAATGFVQGYDEADCYLQYVSSMVSMVRCPVQCMIRRAPFSSRVIFSLGDGIRWLVDLGVTHRACC
jgi:hypothetical protein